MIRSSFIAMLLLCVACSFCGKYFVTLGRHTWRCKQRVHQEEQTGSEDTRSREAPILNSPTVVISNRTVVKCCCGKICKGARDLKMHHRSCQVIDGLNNELCSDLEEHISDNNTEDLMVDDDNTNLNTAAENETTPLLKKGINLPKKDSEW